MNPHPKGSMAYDWWELHRALARLFDTVRRPVVRGLTALLDHPSITVAAMLTVLAVLIAANR